METFTRLAVAKAHGVAEVDGFAFGSATFNEWQPYWPLLAALRNGGGKHSQADNGRQYI